jgi:hypothetical protein
MRSTEIQSKRTEIQKVIDFLLDLYPNHNIIQAYTEDVISKIPTIAVQEVIKSRASKTWGNLSSVESIGVLKMGYSRKVSYKIHCSSLLSFDEADRLADLVEAAFYSKSSVYDWNIGRREHMLWVHDIISCDDFYRRVIVPDSESAIWRVVCDVDLTMRFTEELTIPEITTINKEAEFL